MVLAWGAARLRFDVEILNLLPGSDPAVKGLRIYQAEFANSGQLVIALDASSAEAATEAAESLAKELRTLDDAVASVVWTPPWKERPAEFAELAAYLWLNQPPEVFSEWTNRLAPAQLSASLEAAQERLAISFSPSEIARLSYDPLGLTELPSTERDAASRWGSGEELFASKEGDFRILFVQARSDLARYRECARWMDQIEDAVQRWKVRSSARDVEVRMTGRPAFVREIAIGMERDLAVSVIATSLIIALLFWIVHRRWIPLLLLLLSLAATLACAIAAGGFLLGTLNVVSTGFAAVLLGLAADYGMVLHQEHRANPNAPAEAVRSAAGRGIVWSAVTTGAAFALLNLSGLPGVGQLGSLVAAGIFIAAAIMLYVFLPLCVRAGARGDGPASASTLRPEEPRPRTSLKPAAIAAGALLAIMAGALWTLGFPPLDASPDALRPRQSDAYEAVRLIQTRMRRPEEPLWVVARASGFAGMSDRLESAQEALERARATQLVESFSLATPLWPRPERQRANLPVARQLSQEQSTILRTAKESGFTDDATALAEGVLGVWRRAAAGPVPFWPTNFLSRWTLDQFIDGTNAPFHTVGLIQPSPASTLDAAERLNALGQELADEEIYLAGWNLLGYSVLKAARRDVLWLCAPVALALIVSLSFAFRRMREVWLSLASLVFSAFLLLALMRLFGWSWNLLNLMAAPLLLGAAVDYSIHVQLALRRHRGAVRVVWRTVGQALALCAATTAAAFGTLALSSNAGLASLGRICALGAVVAFCVAVLLLPAAWLAFEKNRPG